MEMSIVHIMYLKWLIREFLYLLAWLYSLHINTSSGALYHLQLLFMNQNVDDYLSNKIETNYLL